MTLTRYVVICYNVSDLCYYVYYLVYRRNDQIDGGDNALAPTQLADYHYHIFVLRTLLKSVLTLQYFLFAVEAQG